MKLPLVTLLALTALATACGASRGSSVQSASARSGASADLVSASTAVGTLGTQTYTDDERASGGQLTQVQITQSASDLATATIQESGIKMVDGVAQPFATTKTLSGLSCTSTATATVCTNDARAFGGALSALQLQENADGTYTATLRVQGIHRPRPTIYQHSTVLATKLAKS